MPIKTRKPLDMEFVPMSHIHGTDVVLDYPECFYPKYEDNAHAVLHVCICDGCEDAKPRLKELAEMYRLTLTYIDKDGIIRPLYKLF